MIVLPATFTVRTAGATLEAEAWGDVAAPTVLLLSGTSCTRDWWPPELCASLAALGTRVVRFDQRDTGASTHWPVGEPGYALPDLAADAIRILDALAVERAHLVGLSQGGWVAQLIGIDHPERAASLTLIATRPTGHGPADRDLPEVTGGLLAAWSAMEEPDWKDTESVITSFVESERALAGERFDERAVRRICAAAAARTDDLRAATNHPLMDCGPRWRERLPKVRVPTTVLHGTADPLFPLANAVALSHAIAGAELRLLRGVGHELPKRVWPELVAVLSDRLRVS